MDEEFNATRVMKVIDHPVRMRIIELLATKGPMSWKELSSEIGTGTGALYHHLDTLEQIVTRDSSKKYSLTKRGDDLFHYLIKKPLQTGIQDLDKVIHQKSLSGALKSIFIPRSLIRSITSTKLESIASLIGITLIMVVILGFSGDRLLLFSFSPSDNFLISAATVIGSVFALGALTNATAIALKAKSEPLTLLSSSALSLLPMTAFSLLIRTLFTSADPFFAGRTLFTIALAFFQAWGAGIIGAGMSVASGVRIEKTLLLSLILLYLTMVIILLQNEGLP